MILMLSAVSIGAEVVVEPKLEIPLFVGVLGGYYYLKSQEPRDMTAIAMPKGIDSWGAPRWNAAAIPFSDFMGHPLKLYGCNLPVLSTLGTGVFMGLDKGGAVGLEHSFVVMEAVAVSALLTQGLKGWISRPRPFTSLAFQKRYPNVYSGPYIQEELSSRDAWFSMPSGHTSAAGATYTSIATLLSVHHPQQRYWFYSVAAVLTTITGASRVIAGMHHPSDVLVGGIIGAGIGYAVARLHIKEDSDLGSVDTTGLQQRIAPNFLLIQGAW